MNTPLTDAVSRGLMGPVSTALLAGPLPAVRAVSSVTCCDALD